MKKTTVFDTRCSSTRTYDWTAHIFRDHDNAYRHRKLTGVWTRPGNSPRRYIP